MAASENDFTDGTSDVQGGGDLKVQWPPLSRSIKSLTAFWRGMFSRGTEPDHVLRGLGLGDDADTLAWRIYAKDGNAGLSIQENTASDASPVWVERALIDSTGLGGGGAQATMGKTAPQTLLNGVGAPVTWDTEDTDGITYGFVAGNPTVLVAGTYLVEFHLHMVAEANIQTRLSASVNPNGGAGPQLFQVPGHTVTGQEFELRGVAAVVLAVNDYIEINAAHLHGGATVTSRDISPTRTQLKLTRIG